METLDSLNEKIRAGLDELRERAKAKSKYLPVPMQIGPGGSLQQAAETAFCTTLRQLGLRDYAADPITFSEGAGLVIACVEAKANLARVVETLADVTAEIVDPEGRKTVVTTGLRQERPPSDAGQIPELPIDPCTGLRVSNPWEGKLDTDKAKSREIIKNWSPRLARFLEDVSKNQGVSMHMLTELRLEREEAEFVRQLQYGKTEWEANFLRPELNKNLTERSLFIRGLNNEWLERFHKREAALGNPRLQFSNLTYGMALAKRDPAIREIHRQAHEILKGWQAEAEQKAAA
jgi:hypothetical protein